MPTDVPTRAASASESHSGRKRRTSRQSISAADNTGITSTTKQQTLNQHFPAAVQKQSAYGPQSPTSKRLKPNPPERTPPQLQSRPLASDNMYSFPAKSPARAKVQAIDLTGSPGATPSPQRQIRATFNPHTGAKKLEVRNKRTKERNDPRKYFEQIWSQLQVALAAIFGSGKDVNTINGALGTSLEELYRGVENLCRQGFAEELYKRLETKCTEHVVRNVKEPLRKYLDQSNVEVLSEVLEAWGIWKGQLKITTSIFFYLDRSYLLPRSSSIQSMGIHLFRSQIFDDSDLQSCIIDGPCDLIALDREPQPFQPQLLRQSISLLHDLGVYTKVFEPRFLELSREYIMQWTDENCKKDLAAYVQQSVALMERETKRCDNYGLDVSTRRDLLALLETHIIERKADRLVEPKDVATLLDQNAASDLEQLYKLLERRRLTSRLRGPFEKWIFITGTSIVFSEKDQDQMITRLLSLKRQLDTIWRVSFRKNEDLGHALRESFEQFINKTRKSSDTYGTDNSKVGEYIAKYVDQLLRGGVKAIPSSLNSVLRSRAASTTNAADSAVREEIEAEHEDDDEYDEDQAIDDQLDQVLDLFRFLHGKAVFEAFYKKDLAKRLLMGRSADEEKERGMLARLKTECGSGFTQNLEQMFNDISLSREEQASYRSILSERQEHIGIDLSVHVLASSAWPTYPEIPVAIPPNVKKAVDAYTDHYQAKHSGRKLTWKHALSHCQLKANFPKAKKELVVSSFQAVVLLHFNKVADEEKVSYAILKAETGLPDADLKRTLQSLACAKLRPLTKHPKGRDIAETDTFSLNLGFSHDKYRVKINQVQHKETKEENKATHERVAEDRNFETQAAIVRIMKSRKTIGHSELIAEVINATKSRGVLAVPDIKKNIDRLIDKDYMEREEGNMYSYIA